MLIRAAIASLLLHLLISLSLMRLDVMPQGGTSGRDANAALSMHIARRIEGDLTDPALKKAPLVDAKSHVAGRKSGSPRESKPAQAKHYKTLPPTAEEAKSAEVPASPTPGAGPSEQMPMSAELLGRYRLSVARNARQFKVYPSLAREKGWEGVAVILVAMPMGPGNPMITLGRTSGYDVLDRQALEMLEQAVGLAALPEGLRGKNLTISLPVEYRRAD